MKRLLLAFLLPSIAFADAYQCTDSGGKISYSDRPCPEGSAQAIVRLQQNDWVERLKSNLPEGVEISSLSKIGAETTIAFTFTQMEQASQFVRLAAKISGQGTALLKITAPRDDQQGSAEVKVSKGMQSLFRKQSERQSQ